MAAPLTLVAYEHEQLRLGERGLREAHLAALLRLQQRSGTGASSWFTVLRRGLQLGGYVGVVQVPGLVLEILPKTDDPSRPGTAPGAADHWRQVLLRLLRATTDLPLAVPGAASLAQAPHAMLDLFVTALLAQAETLLRQGLRKQYQASEANRPALRGRLLFAQQLRHNLVRAERFYTQAQTYSLAHQLNALLRQALAVAAEVAQASALAARARAVLAHWPDVPPVPVPAALPALGLATARYRPALELALLLLRHHSPTPQAGHLPALALLFDMNQLFEAYVARQLTRAAPALGCQVSAQSSRPFWHDVPVRPDLVLTLPGPRLVILDTKWKLPTRARPAAADLQQLFAYCHLWHAQHGVLLYPNPAAGLRPAARQPYAPGHLPLHVHGHIMFADILRPDGKLDQQFGPNLLRLLLALDAA